MNDGATDFGYPDTTVDWKIVRSPHPSGAISYALGKQVAVVSMLTGDMRFVTAWCARSMDLTHLLAAYAQGALRQWQPERN
jgi:hypothetical protein